MRRTLFQAEHPDIANSLNNLGATLRELGRSAEAEPLHREALEMRRKLFRQDHTDVAVSLNNLASVLRDQGKFSEALPLQRECLELQRRLLGPDPHHPDQTPRLLTPGAFEGRSPQTHAYPVEIRAENRLIERISPQMTGGAREARGVGQPR